MFVVVRCSGEGDGVQPGFVKAEPLRDPHFHVFVDLVVTGIYDLYRISIVPFEIPLALADKIAESRFYLLGHTREKLLYLNLCTITGILGYTDIDILVKIIGIILCGRGKKDPVAFFDLVLPVGRVFRGELAGRIRELVPVLCIVRLGRKHNRKPGYQQQ